MKANSDLSIVVPAYNEAQRIGSLLSDIASFARFFDGSFEIILADDGSTDDTIAVAQHDAAPLGLADNLHVLPSPKTVGKGTPSAEVFCTAAAGWSCFAMRTVRHR